MNDIIIALAKAAILVALNQPEDFDLEAFYLLFVWLLME